VSTPQFNVESLNNRSKNTLPGLIGIEIISLQPNLLQSKLRLREELLAPNGYLHAATVVALADTSCGYGCIANMPAGGQGFTTIELKSNFIGTLRSGTLICEAKVAHGGRTTQVWDATVKDEQTGKTIALFRCTQLIIYGMGKESN
jgi:uncharacterized protein (TIGR00369 family)